MKTKWMSKRDFYNKDFKMKRENSKLDISLILNKYRKS